MAPRRAGGIPPSPFPSRRDPSRAPAARGSRRAPGLARRENLVRAELPARPPALPLARACTREFAIGAHERRRRLLRLARARGDIGGTGRIRTAEYGFCRPGPYHLATVPFSYVQPGGGPRRPAYRDGARPFPKTRRGQYHRSRGTPVLEAAPGHRAGKALARPRRSTARGARHPTLSEGELLAVRVAADADQAGNGSTATTDAYRDRHSRTGERAAEPRQGANPHGRPGRGALAWETGFHCAC